MAISSGFDSNLAITLLGVSISGGLAYGGYEVFKNKPQPATELLKSKKKIALDKESEEDKTIGNANGAKYVKDHTTKETREIVDDPAGAAPASKKGSKKPVAKPKKTIIKREFKEKDLGELPDGLNQREATEAPNSFKDKCETIKETKLNGTGSSEYRDFENYCSKDDTSEDEETTN